MTTPKKAPVAAAKSVAAKKTGAPKRAKASIEVAPAEGKTKAAGKSAAISQNRAVKASESVADTGPASIKPDAKPDKYEKSDHYKTKRIRDRYSLSQDDADLIQALKRRTLGFERVTKKSELLRAGVLLLARLDDEQLRRQLDALPSLPPARDKK